MDSAGPTDVRITGQPTVSAGSITFALAGITTKAETGFHFDWLVRAVQGRPHRGPHHPPATGDRPAA